MPIHIPSGYGQATITHSTPSATQDQIITFGFFFATTALTPDEMASQIYSLWGGTGQPYDPATVADSNELVSVKVTMNVAGVLLFGEAVTLTFGTRTTQPPAPQVAVVVKKRSGVVGRANRGRFYLPAAFLVQTHVSLAGIIDTADVTAMQTRLTGFLTDLATAETEMCILHTDPALTPTIVTSLVVEQMVGTQRRRLR